MGHSVEDAYLVRLPRGTVLVVHPDYGLETFSEHNAAEAFLRQDGWKKFLTFHGAAMDPIDKWVRASNPRADIAGVEWW